MIACPLITGPGRSGTHYTAALLRRLGYRATHEKRFPMSSFGAAWYLEVVRRGLEVGAMTFFVEKITPPLVSRLLRFLDLSPCGLDRIAGAIQAQPREGALT